MTASFPSELWIGEPDGAGHRLWYVRLLLEAAAAQGRTARLVTTRGAAESEEWRVHLARSEPSSTTYDEWEWATVLADSSRAGAQLLVPDADRYLSDLVKHARRASPSRTTLLMMRPNPSPGARGLAAFGAKAALLGASKMGALRARVFSLAAAPGQADALSRLGLATPVCDPIEVKPWKTTRAAWLEGHGLDPTVPTVVVAGELSVRKHLPEIVSAWVNAGENRPQLALIGRPDTDTRSAIESVPERARRRLHRDDSYVTDQDFDSWIGYADAVVVLHRNAGSSGVLLKASAMDVPVIYGGHKTVIDAARALAVQGCPTGADAAGIKNALSAVVVRESRSLAPRIDDRGFCDALLGSV